MLFDVVIVSLCSFCGVLRVCRCDCSLVLLFVVIVGCLCCRWVSVVVVVCRRLPSVAARCYSSLVGAVVCYLLSLRLFRVRCLVRVVCLFVRCCC